MNTTTPLTGSVGVGGLNNPADAKLVQMLINNWLRQTKKQPLEVDGIVGPKTTKGIAEYQRSFDGVIDSRIDPQGPTIKTLVSLQMQLLLEGAPTRLLEMAKLKLHHNEEFTSSTLHVDIAEILNTYFQAAKKT